MNMQHIVSIKERKVDMGCLNITYPLYFVCLYLILILYF
nr:MAG TPA: hypothetical protein [Caudoviricetes sp.]